MQDFLTPELTGQILEVIGMVVGLVVLLVLRYVRLYLEKKLGEARYLQLKARTAEIVRYLDQFGANVGLGTNEQKKLYASNRVKELADRLGIEMTMEEVGILVESTYHAVKPVGSILGEFVEGGLAGD